MIASELQGFLHTGHCTARVHGPSCSTRGFVQFGPFDLTRQSDYEKLDLLEMRRQLTALRSQHSGNLTIVWLLNRLLVKVAVLSEPIDAKHGQRLRSDFEETLRKVEAIAAGLSSKKKSTVTKPSK